jgi:dTDP-4-dehydrorhamnose reductase
MKFSGLELHGLLEFVHLSAEHVFSGSKISRDDEQNLAHPVSVYGASRRGCQGAARAGLLRS